tara:strand:- start:1325 stop:1450 length:126 start_codon:yes stop_codon:yes gene_type:complete
MRAKAREYTYLRRNTREHAADHFAALRQRLWSPDQNPPKSQ